jgi:flagellar biosynthesis protein FlhA
MKQYALLKQNSELFMILSAIGILFILFIPIPASFLDFLLIINFSWALTILLLTFYTDKPLSFSTFPALLLMSTLFRLALNISATRLILSDGDAGDVIHAMGQYVIHGNYVMGLVVFLILIIVQFIVVTNGAQRVAEVAARFTLDSMPGKQMSIDADLNMGSISLTEAKNRRAQIEREANFYGAMDGASKFVKGDAIAGILIMLVDIIGGFAIGLIQKGFSLTQSIQTYTLLTVGDGLVTQIPALIISTATGIIVTRAATDAYLGQEVIKQITDYPKSLVMVCCGLIGLLFLNGIPVFPIVILLSLLIPITSLIFKQQKAENTALPEINLYEAILIKPIEINFNPQLYTELVQHQVALLQSMQQIREKIAFDLGFIIPDVHFKSCPKLKAPYYQLIIGGTEQRAYPLYLDKILALNVSQGKEAAIHGIEVRDPTYNLPAMWIDPLERQTALNAGCSIYDPIMVLCTHFNEVIQAHLSELLTREETEKMLSQPSIKSLSDALIPSLLPLSSVQRILQCLLQEKVSIRHLNHIVELLLEHTKQTTDPLQLTEFIRAGLAVAICQKLLSHQNILEVLTLGSTLEQQLNQQLSHKECFAIDPLLTEQVITSLSQHVARMLKERKRPILLCASPLRRQLKQLTQRVMPHLAVLGMNEIPLTIQVESFAVIQ